MSLARILNIAAYKFVPIDDADMLAERVQALAEQHALRGSVLVADEGINLFLAGPDTGVHAVLATLREDTRFADLTVKFSRSRTLPFAKLKVKRKREIIAFRRDDASPLDERAAAVEPATLARWITQGQDDRGRPLRLLDTRNREEVAYGTFAGALTLPIDNFTDFPDALAPHRETLADACIVSFCTGGIRCEKAALWMQANGFPEVLQLDGGILNYFEQVGGAGYDGRCFVFDERVALDPDLQPLHDTPRHDSGE